MYTWAFFIVLLASVGLLFPPNGLYCGTLFCSLLRRFSFLERLLLSRGRLFFILLVFNAHHCLGVQAFVIRYRHIFPMSCFILHLNLWFYECWCHLWMWCKWAVQNDTHSHTHIFCIQYTCVKYISVCLMCTYIILYYSRFILAK